MAPSTYEDNDVPKQNRVIPELGSAVGLKKSKPNMLRSMSSKILASDAKQKLDIPEETVVAHGRATMIASALSNVPFRRDLNTHHSSETTDDNNIDSLYSRMVTDLGRQRAQLSRRDKISFDKSWRYRSIYTYYTF